MELEDALVIAVCVIFAVSIAYIMYVVRARNRKNEEQYRRRMEEIKRAREETLNRWKTTTTTRVRATSTPMQKQTVTPNAVGIQAGRNVNVVVPSSSSTDIADLATALLLNSTLNNHSGTSRAKVDYDSGSINISDSSPTVSDDSPSKSSSWYSSSSSSDSGSSWSSSSDSGPSSDW